eukprot:9271894-Alexandrium_andersonii.AAC.1
MVRRGRWQRMQASESCSLPFAARPRRPLPTVLLQRPVVSAPSATPCACTQSQDAALATQTDMCARAVSYTHLRAHETSAHL